jgi:hypothetical protein
MSQRDSISMEDLVHGKDYLVNFYEMFGVTPEQVVADRGVLDKPRRELMVKYHSDKYAHLPEVFRRQAEYVFHNIELGYEILKDKIKREAYEKQLAEWKGPISTSGFPIYDPNFYTELHRTPLTNEQIEEVEEILGHLTGYDSDTHAVLERQLDKGSTDPQVKRAFDRSLLGKEVLYGVQEHLYWSNAGLTKPELEGNTPAGYLDQVRADLATAREQIPQRAQILLLQANSGQIKLLGPGGEDQTDQLITDPKQALVKITEILTSRFDEVAPKIEALAAEQEQIRNQRLELLEGEYRPKQRKLHPRLILCLQKDKRILYWMAFKMLDTQSIVSDESLTKEQMERVADPEEARRWIRRGYNVMFLQIRDALDLTEQVEEVVQKHFDLYNTKHAGE